MNRPHVVYSLSTEYFDILYTKSSETSALLIENKADQIYKAAFDFFQKQDTNRIIVVLSPDSEVFSAEYSGSPYNKILIYDLPSKNNDSQYQSELLDSFSETVWKAVSQNIRSPFWQFMAAWMGDLIQPVTLLNVPYSFLEGVAVLKDFGGSEREIILNTDLYYLSKAKTSGKFPSWRQAAGGYDLYPNERLHKAAGKAFIEYIIEKYGQEKFVEFWKLGGQLNFFKLTAGNFKKIYGISLDAAWNDFKNLVPLLDDSETERPAGFEDSSEHTYTFLQETAFGYVWFDEIRREVNLLNKTTSWRELLFMADNVKDLQVSKNGNYIAVRFIGNQIRENLSNEILWFYDLKERSFTDEINLQDNFEQKSVTQRMSFDEEMEAYKDVPASKRYNPLKYIFRGAVIPFFALDDLTNSEELNYVPSVGMVYVTNEDPLSNHSIILSASAGFLQLDSFKIQQAKDEQELENKKFNISFSHDFSGLALYKNSATPVDWMAGVFTRFTKDGKYDVRYMSGASLTIPMGMNFRTMRIKSETLLTKSTEYYNKNKIEEYPSLPGWTAMSDSYGKVDFNIEVFYSNVHQSGFSPYQKVGITLDSMLWALFDLERKQERSATYLALSLNSLVQLPRIIPVDNINGWIFSLPAKIELSLFKDEINALTMDFQIMPVGKELQFGVPFVNMYLKRTGLFCGYKMAFDYSSKLDVRPDIRNIRDTATALSNCYLNDSIYFIWNFGFAPIIGKFSKTKIDSELRGEYFIRKQKWEVTYHLNFGL